MKSRTCIGFFLVFFSASPGLAEEARLATARSADPPALPLDATELMRRAEDIMRGDTVQMKITMNITTPRWQRELSFRMWDRDQPRLLRMAGSIGGRGGRGGSGGGKSPRGFALSILSANHSARRRASWATWPTSSTSRLVE